MNVVEDDRDVPKRLSRRGEVLTFLVLALAVWPVLAVGTVASDGFLVWFYQMIFGPPGPPGH
jgi:periplasmic nitrate reductase NapE